MNKYKVTNRNTDISFIVTEEELFEIATNWINEWNEIEEMYHDENDEDWRDRLWHKPTDMSDVEEILGEYMDCDIEKHHEEEYVITVIHDTNSEEYFGTPNKIIEQVLEFLHNLNIDFENAYIKDYEELFEDVYTRKYEELQEYLSYIENANDTVVESRNELVKDLQEIVDKSNSTIIFK